MYFIIVKCLVINNRCYSFNNPLGGNVIKTSIVAALAGLVAEDTAGAAVKIHLNGILSGLVETEESCQRMSGSPDADHRSGRQRGQMHIGGVHGKHHIEMAHEYQFLVHRFTMLADIHA